MKWENKLCYPTGNELITAEVEKLKVFPEKAELGIGQKYRKMAWEEERDGILEKWNFSVLSTRII